MGCVNTFLPLVKISGCPFGLLAASDHMTKRYFGNISSLLFLRGLNPLDNITPFLASN